MKGQRIIFSKESDEWKTPHHLVKFLNKHFRISVDPCCSVFNVKAKKHYTIKEDGLKQKWETWTFINPPYSNILVWMEKTHKEYISNNVKSIVLAFAKTDTIWFQRYAFKANYILFIKGRLVFRNPKSRKKNSAPFGNALIIYGRINRYQHKALKGLGTLIKLG